MRDIIVGLLAVCLFYFMTIALVRSVERVNRWLGNDVTELAEQFIEVAWLVAILLAIVQLGAFGQQLDKRTVVVPAPVRVEVEESVPN